MQFFTRPHLGISRSPSRLGAFTLVELLVVIGIISILLAILLPSLGRAREHARAIVCENNEKQIAAAILMYVNDNQGQLPLIVAPYPPYQTPFEAICMVSGAQLDYETGVLWPYISRDVETRQRMFNCPSDPDPKYYVYPDPSITPPPPEVPRNFSYSITYEINRASTTPKRARILAGGTADTTGVYATPLTTVRHPDHKMLVIERQSPGGICDGDSVNVHVSAGSSGRTISLLSSRHSGRANIAFFDGHCEPVDAGLFSEISNTVFTPNYYYYVDALHD